MAATASVALDGVLASIRSKIESRTSRPWFDLQRNYYFKNTKGIRNTTELRSALDHFHCALRSDDLELLIASFPRDDGTFDFKAFASRLYPHQDKSGFEVIRDGRHLHTLPAQYATSPSASASAASASVTTGGTIYPPPLGDTPYYESKDTVPIAESYDARTTYMPVNQVYTRALNPTQRAVTARRTLPALAHNRRAHLRYHDRGVQPLLNGPPRVVAQSYPDHEFRGHGQYHSLKNQPRFKMKPLPTPKFESTRVL